MLYHQAGKLRQHNFPSRVRVTRLRGHHSDLDFWPSNEEL